MKELQLEPTKFLLLGQIMYTEKMWFQNGDFRKKLGNFIKSCAATRKINKISNFKTNFRAKTENRFEISNFESALLPCQLALPYYFTFLECV